MKYFGFCYRKSYDACVFFQVYRIDGGQISLAASEQYESNLTQDSEAPFGGIRNIYAPMLIEGTVDKQ